MKKDSRLFCTAQCKYIPLSYILHLRVDLSTKNFLIRYTKQILDEINIFRKKNGFVLYLINLVEVNGIILFVLNGL